MKKIYFFHVLTLCLLAGFVKAQEIDSVNLNVARLQSKHYSEVDKKLVSIDNHLSNISAKYLAKFQKRENKIRKKLRKLNPENILADANEKYDAFFEKITTLTSSKGFLRISEKLSNKSPPADDEEYSSTPVTGEYNPYLDSLGTSLSFLKQYEGISDKVKEPLASLHSLESQLQQSEKIKAFIAERKNQLTEALSQFTKIPSGLKSQYDKVSKTAYYYSAQVNEYKEMLKDPKKIEQKALSLLNKLPAFQKFMKENSQLASLFRTSGSSPLGGSQEGALTGLQTRSSVQSLIQQRIASGGPNAQAQIQQNLAAAHAELDKLKDKINQLGGGGSGSDPEMPDFKPNSQKTKSFLKRLEYSADVQFSKTNNLLPSAANIGLGLGYKLNDKRLIGIGLGYKMGMGSIHHISITHQGIGLRSYGDYKIKGSIFISGGYEMNYNATFKDIEQLKNYNAWQRSALIGISKKYKISKKVKGEMKVLYDFLANQHLPVSQPILFRTGYKL